MIAMFLSFSITGFTRFFKESGVGWFYPLGQTDTDDEGWIAVANPPDE